MDIDIKTQNLVRFVASYQMFGDAEPRQWMQFVFDTAKSEREIVDSSILEILQSRYGINCVFFTVDVCIDWDTPYDDAIKFGKKLCDEIVHDSDVQIHWVGPVQEQK